MTQPEKRAKGPLIDRERLFAEFDILTEESVAALLGIKVKTLRDRPLAQKPASTKIGQDRVYHRQSVKEFLDAAKIEQGGGMPMFRRRPSPKAKKPTKAKPKPPARRARADRAAAAT